MVVVIPMYLVCGAACIIQGVLWAVDNKTLQTMSMLVVITLLVFLTVFGFNSNWGVEGLWLGLDIGAGLNGLLYLWFLCGLNWKQAAKDASDRAIEHRAVQSMCFNSSKSNLKAPLMDISV